MCIATWLVMYIGREYIQLTVCWMNLCARSLHPCCQETGSIPLLSNIINLKLNRTSLTHSVGEYISYIVGISCKSESRDLHKLYSTNVYIDCVTNSRTCRELAK